MTSPSIDAALPWDGQPYSVKRHGVSVRNCDSEPVHTPGCVQAHGALLALRASDLTVRQASDNARVVLGHAVDDLLGRPVSVVVGDEAQARLRQAVAREPIDRNPTYLFTLPATPARGDALDVSVHLASGVVIVEFEPTGRGLAPQPDYYALLKTAVARLQNAASLQSLCTIAVDEVRALTGLDRVMVYRFHPDHHGEVFAESRRDDLPPWLGLHYPADDIPLPAREIFKRLWIRPVPDIDAELSELVPLVDPDTGRPLDMTHCALRGPSVMYTEYLRNMGVRSSLTMPIRHDGELWGLIACHHYASSAPAPWAMRAACELLAQVVSLQYRAAAERDFAEYRRRLEGVHQQLVAAAAQEGGLAAMTEATPNLLDAMNAGGVALYHRDRWWCVGRTPAEADLDALATWLAQRPEFDAADRPVYSTDSLMRDYPPGERLRDVAAGVLALPLSRARRNLMLWFRPEVLQTVRWGGNPHDKPMVPGPHGPRLTPRASFELFVESVSGRAAPWLPVEVEAAARLRMLVMELVISRAENLAALNADLARSNEELDAFAYVASHDLKEPLRGIHKYAHQLLEQSGGLSTDDRHKLEALMRLTQRMDSLLNALLHLSRVGRAELHFEDVDLAAVLDEAIEMVGGRLSTTPATFVVPRPLPLHHCDRVRVREVFVNLLSNALKYSDRPMRRIEVGWIDAAPGTDVPGLQPGDHGHRVFYVRDDGIGIRPQHAAQVFDLFKRLHTRDQYGGGTGAGLAIVRLLVERQGGRVWLDSAFGHGTTFYFTLPSAERGSA